eukprot:TRINITY_DN10047_c0_g2_i1.p1 TRINITY_DN10047_c0_g2~~TRINITY_DN10047_c0_g2_i1.p1  ORF type:complete len:684 (+),score=69.82 TRINITY_DN10047_c0_g2_i1:73-2052(+)
MLRHLKSDDDDSRRKQVASDVKLAQDMLRERLLKPAEKAAKEAAHKAAKVEEDVRKVGRDIEPRSDAASIAIAKFDTVLGALPDHACVAVITMLGSLCPVTLGHVQCYIEARRIILDEAEKQATRPARLQKFDECLGLVWLNSDRNVGVKLAEKKQQPINIVDRGHLIDLATAEYPWLCYDEVGHGMNMLRERWRKLKFIEIDMNGADDVVKYSKWRFTSPSNRMIVMGRPGSTAAVVEGMKRSSIDPDEGTCFLGPELPDISSTAARDASARGDRKTLLTMLHPHVADWLLRRDGHERSVSSIAIDLASSTTLKNVPSLTSTRSSANKASALKIGGRASLEKCGIVPTAAGVQLGPRASKSTIVEARVVGSIARKSNVRPHAQVASAADIVKKTHLSQGEQLVENAWSLVIGKSHTPRPLTSDELREQLRVHLVETQADQLPKGFALKSMDDLLQHELKQKIITQSCVLERTKVDKRLALWQGDITTLKIDGIVNAANQGGRGCFKPDHRCIDNVIHCAAGPALRVACDTELKREPFNGELPTSEVLVTPAYNLPCDHVLHVPGPYCPYGVEQPEKLARCYQNVLDACVKNSIRSVAFCCISTGLFGYPSASAANVAVSTVREWLNKHAAGDGQGPLDLVVFNVFCEKDFSIYQGLLD